MHLFIGGEQIFCSPGKPENAPQECSRGDFAEPTRTASETIVSLERSPQRSPKLDSGSFGFKRLFRKLRTAITLFRPFSGARGNKQNHQTRGRPKSSSRPARSFVSWRCVTTHPPGLSCAISCIERFCKLPRRWREKSQRETRETRRHMTRITQSRSQARLHAKSVSSSVHCFRDRRASTGRHKHMREKPPPHA